MTKKIKLKASKPMADYLNRSCPYDVRLIKMTDDDYRWYVDTAVLTHIEDYSSKTGLFSVIKVIYPDNYYAAPKYFTTRICWRCTHPNHQHHSARFLVIML